MKKAVAAKGGRASAPLFIFLAACAADARADGWRPYAAMESFGHSEPVSIHDYINDWEGPLQSGSDAVTHNWLETGARNGAWSIGYVQRYDYEIKASRDAALLYHQIKNKQDLVPGTVYDLDLRAFHNRSQGLRLAREFRHGNWRLEPGFSLLSGQALIDGAIHGVASAVDVKEYSFNAAVSYHYTEDALFDRQVDGPSGEGFALDLALGYRFSERWNLELSGRDLLGFLYWREAPVTDAIATSDTQEFDDDGYLQFRPTLTGREFNRDYHQRLHPRGLASLQWQAREATRLDLKLRMTEVRQYASLAAAQQLAPGLALDLEWMSGLDALGLGLRWADFRAQLMSDSLRFEDAQVLQLQLGWAYRF